MLGGSWTNLAGDTLPKTDKPSSDNPAMAQAAKPGDGGGRDPVLNR